MPGSDYQFRFRALTEADIPVLYDWLRRPHLVEWWRGEQSPGEVRARYLPRIRTDDGARPFIALLDDAPAGYIQYYYAGAGDPAWVAGWWPDTPGAGVLGIDQFLADGARLGRGMGTAMVARFSAGLFQDPAVTEIRVDPHPDNRRAIRCYEKVGFREWGPISTPDGPAIMMVLDRGGLRDRSVRVPGGREI